MWGVLTPLTNDVLSCPLHPLLRQKGLPIHGGQRCPVLGGRWPGLYTPREALHPRPQSLLRSSPVTSMGPRDLPLVTARPAEVSDVSTDHLRPTALPGSESRHGACCPRPCLASSDRASLTAVVFWPASSRTNQVWPLSLARVRCLEMEDSSGSLGTMTCFMFGGFMNGGVAYTCPSRQDLLGRPGLRVPNCFKRALHVQISCVGPCKGPVMAQHV